MTAGIDVGGLLLALGCAFLAPRGEIESVAEVPGQANARPCALDLR